MKILQLFIKIEFDPAMANKSDQDKARVWGRIGSLISSFEDEHHVYLKFYFDGYDLRSYAGLKQDYLKSGLMGGWKIPEIGGEARRPPSPGYIARESGFEVAGVDNDDEYNGMTVE